MIPLFKVFMADDVDEFVVPVLKSGYIGEGEKVAEFEKAVGDFIGNPNVLAVSSGTMAIQIALRLAGVGVGDYVITTPMTCLATNEPILALGAKPVWVDVDPVTGCMCAAALKRVIEVISNDGNEFVVDTIDRTCAVLCMHWGGMPCDIHAIGEIAGGIPVIEDACQAFGSTYSGCMIGSYSNFVCLSFQAIKHLTTGDGGAIAFLHKDDLERARLMKWFGLDRRKSNAMRCSQDPPEYGYKAQMNDISAAIGLANIRHTEALLEKVAYNAARYDIAFSVNRKYGVVSSNWLYTIHVNDSSGFISYMKGNGVDVGKVHARNDTKSIFASSPSAKLPGVDAFDRTHVCLPVGWWLTEDDVTKIIKLVKKYREVTENG